MVHDTSTLLKADRFQVIRLSYETENGKQERDVIRHPGAVTIFPLVSDDQVCLIRNFRPAVGKTLIELPAGTLEQGESPESTARRELVEETGYQAQEFRLLRQFFLSPGILDERMYLYLAQDLEYLAPQREAGEQIENLVVSLREAVAMVDDGRIEDAKTIIGIQLAVAALSK